MKVGGLMTGVRVSASFAGTSSTANPCSGHSRLFHVAQTPMPFRSSTAQLRGSDQLLSQPLPPTHCFAATVHFHIVFLYSDHIAIPVYRLFFHVSRYSTTSKPQVAPLKVKQCRASHGTMSSSSSSPVCPLDLLSRHLVSIMDFNR